MSSEGTKANKCFSVPMAAMKSVADFTEIGPAAERSLNVKFYGQPGTTPRLTVEVASIIAVAPGHEEALEMGLNSARERWPESEGFFGHSAGATPVSRANIEKILGEID